MDELSKNLRKLLSFFNLSENELGRRSGVPQQVINRILTGKNNNPKITTLASIAKYFSITISQLLGEDALPLEPRLNKMDIVKIPLIKWNQLSRLPKELKNKKNNKIMTDAMVSESSFAIPNQDDSMDPRFPEHAILIFDCNPTPKHMDFVLIYNENKKSAAFRQLWLKNNMIYAKCLNLKNEDYKLKKLHGAEKIIATLIQAKVDFL